MTLTDDRRTRSASRPDRTGAPVPVRSRLTVDRALDDVYRVVEQLPDGARIVGYVQLAGPVYVTLLGPVYNTSVEIAQCLDLDHAITHLERASG